MTMASARTRLLAPTCLWASRRSMMLTRRALVCSATLALAGRPVAQERTRVVFATAGQGSAFLAFGKAVAPVVERYVPVAVEIRETKGSNENAELSAPARSRLRRSTWVRHMMPGMGKDPSPGGCCAGSGPSPRCTRRRSTRSPWRKAASRASRHSRASGWASVRPAAPGGVLPRPRRDAERQGDARRRHAGGARAEALAKEIDAFWYGSGIPSPPFVEIADKAEAVVLAWPPTRLKRCAGSSPISYRMRSRPAPTGDRQKACRRSRCGTSSSSMRPWPAELVYALTQAVLDHADEVRAAYPTAAAMTRANAVANIFLPFHPGAARYYREKAVPVRPGLLN